MHMEHTENKLSCLFFMETITDIGIIKLLDVCRKKREKKKKKKPYPHGLNKDKSLES